MASRGEFVVCNVNYRLLGDQDNTVTLNQITQDALGALLWVKTHIADYGGNPQALAVTGDSAGRQMTAMVVNQSRNLFEQRFNDQQTTFLPTNMPKNMTLNQIREGFLDVQAAVLAIPRSICTNPLWGSDNNGKGGFESPSNFFW